MRSLDEACALVQRMKQEGFRDSEYKIHLKVTKPAFVLFFFGYFFFWTNKRKK